MKRIVVSLPDSVKTRLDGLRRQGYSMAGFVRAAVEKALEGHLNGNKGG
jgi:Arc/MetJ-type ribon-helix-helix transcriptional regulator